MRKFTTVLLWLCIVHIPSWAQTVVTGTVTGKLVDSASGQLLKDASVTILQAKDSTVVNFTLAKTDGSFQVTHIPAGSYLLQVSFLGYQSYYKSINISRESPMVNTGIVYMHTQAKDLDEVVVTQSPIAMKNDTIQYNAGRFTTKPNAVAEDLLQKLPGIDVDKNGGIMAQGEKVQRILVDGKRYFGNDPKMATRNLPPDVIDKIQVFDDLSDQSKFTRFDDGNHIKTINIITKKDKRTGVFGKAIAGIGNDETYDASFNIHRYHGSRQLSVIGQGNDVNKQNFTVQDILGTKTNGATSPVSVNSAGITSTWMAGTNYHDMWGDNTEAYGSYFYNNQHTGTNGSSLQQNSITPDSTTFNAHQGSSIRNNQNHRINFNIEETFNPYNSLIFRPDISTQRTTTPDASSSSATTGGPGHAPIYNSISSSSSKNTGYNINGANLQFRHKFKTLYRTYSIDLNLSGGTNNGENFSNATNTFYTPVFAIDTIRQHANTASNSFNFSPTISYTEPVGRGQVMELNYNHSWSRSNSLRDTYRYDSTQQDYTLFDSLFSNAYHASSNTSRISVHYRIQRKAFNFSIGSGIQFTNQLNNNTTKGVIINRSFTNFTPNANLIYNFSKTVNLKVNYSGRTDQPAISQLQQVLTTRDSVNFQIGNPLLKPQFTHSLRVLFNSFDPVTQRLISATLNASTVLNDIQSAITQLPTGGTSTTYVNLNGTYNVSAYFHYGFALRNPKSNLGFSTTVNYQQYQHLFNDTSNYTRSSNISEAVKWTTNLKDHFDMNITARTTYNISRNTLLAKQNTNYFTHVLSTDITYYTSNGWIIATSFDYTYSNNHSAGYNTSEPLLSPAIAKQFLKKKAGELRLSVFDLLNQNTNYNHSVNGNTITDSKTNVLTRYVMLTFTYNLRKFGGKPR